MKGTILITLKYLGGLTWEILSLDNEVERRMIFLETNLKVFMFSGLNREEVKLKEIESLIY